MNHGNNTSWVPDDQCHNGYDPTIREPMNAILEEQNESKSARDDIFESLYSKRTWILDYHPG